MEVLSSDTATLALVTLMIHVACEDLASFLSHPQDMQTHSSSVLPGEKAAVGWAKGV